MLGNFFGSYNGTVFALCTVWFAFMGVIANANGPTSLKKQQYAYIDVAVATLWTSSKGARQDIDHFATSDPVDITKWARSMSLAEKLDMSGSDRIVTQALYGQPVKIIDRKGKWARIMIISKPGERNSGGYLGWVKASQLKLRSDFRQEAMMPHVVTRNTRTWLFKKTSKGITPVMKLSFNTRLPIAKKTKQWYVVSTPRGDRLIRRVDGNVEVHSYDGGSRPPRSELVTTAKQFKGLPYLWGGTSSFGYDCSGFIHSLYGAYGFTIPRNSVDQFHNGKHANGGLKPGDLMFYAHPGQEPHHVTMYIGHGKMIHAPDSAQPLKIISIYTAQYARQYVGARRYLSLKA